MALWSEQQEREEQSNNDGFQHFVAQQMNDEAADGGLSREQRCARFSNKPHPPPGHPELILGVQSSAKQAGEGTSGQ
jgi:hypothetical protein